LIFASVNNYANTSLDYASDYYNYRGVHPKISRVSAPTVMPATTTLLTMATPLASGPNFASVRSNGLAGGSGAIDLNYYGVRVDFSRLSTPAVLPTIVSLLLSMPPVASEPLIFREWQQPRQCLRPHRL